MKLLIAIPSSENAQKLADTTLRWAGRGGYDFKIFVPHGDKYRKDYEAAIDDANYNWYLTIPKAAIVQDVAPYTYAKENGYDLMVILPDDLELWKKRDDFEATAAHYIVDIGEARKLFSENPKKRIVRWRSNGAVMTRVI